MRPKNTSKENWVIYHEGWYPTKKEVQRATVGLKLPYDIDYIPGARTPFGSYRKDSWRLRKYYLTMYNGVPVSTSPLTLSEAKRVAEFHPGKKLIKVRGAYYYI